MKRDYYEILSVERTASDGEIKSSYRKLAMTYHPDRNPNNPQAEDKFKECSEAYAVLSDPEKRAAYDRFGHQAVGGGGNPFAGGSPFGGGSGGFQQGDLGDIFGDLFGEMFNMGGQRGAGGRASRAQRGRDLKFDMTLSFEEAVFGVEREIKIKRMESCEVCSGTGSEGGKQPETCQQCQGRGQIRTQQGFFSVARTCPVCSGSGQVIRNPCRTCGGDNPRRQGTHSAGQGARRCRIRHSHPLRRRGRCRPLRWAWRRSLRSPQRQVARFLRTRR